MPIDLSSYSTKGPLDPYKLITDLRKIVTLVNRIEVGQTAVQGELRTIVKTVESGGGGAGSVIPAPIGPFPAVVVDVALEGNGTAGSPVSVRVDGVTVIVNGSNQLEAVIPPDVITGTLTPTRIPYASAANVLSDSANLNWDNVNSRVGIGTAAPSETLHVVGAVRITALTTPRVPYAGAGGVLVDNALFNWDNANSRLFVPTIVGGTGVNDDLNLQTTSGAGSAANSRIFFKGGNNGSISMCEMKVDAGGNFGTLGIGTPGNLSLQAPLTIFGTGIDLGYMIFARPAGGTPNCLVLLQTAAGNANAMSGFVFDQQQNGVAWQMTIPGNAGNAMRWRAVDISAGLYTHDVMWCMPASMNILLANVQTLDVTTGTRCLVFEVGTAPTATAANTIAIYAEGSNAELKVMNEADEVTQLSGDMTLASGRLFRLGGSSATEVALKRATTTLEVRLADDSAYAELRALRAIVDAGERFSFSGRSRITSPADSDLLLTNDAASAFNLLQFGGTAATFPALKRSTVVLQTKLADDSAFAQHSALEFMSNRANFLMRTAVAWNDGAGGGAGTLTNAPTAGDPSKWIPVDDNGTTRYIPSWT